MMAEGGGSICDWTADGVDRLSASVELTTGTCAMTFCEKVLPTIGWLLGNVILPDALCVLCRSPAGMIEGTPQLHANAWKISSACVAPVNQPVIDPCELNQNNGKSRHTLGFYFGYIFIKECFFFYQKMLFCIL